MAADPPVTSAKGEAAASGCPVLEEELASLDGRPPGDDVFAVLVDDMSTLHQQV